MVASKTSRRRRKSGSSRGAPSTTVAAVRAAKKAVEALESIGAKFALIGGQAVAARTEPRFTEDVDLAVWVADDRDAQQLARRLLEIAALPVATVGHLIAMKVLSESKTRLQDRIDLEKLLAVATPAELAVAEESLHLVTSRGFARRKKLLAILRRLTPRK